MKKIILVFSFVLIFISTNNANAGNRYPLPKSIPTEFGVDAQYFEISSIQISDLNNDSLSLKFILSIFATEDAKKELGFGQYEIKVSSEVKTKIEEILFPILINNIPNKN